MSLEYLGSYSSYVVRYQEHLKSLIESLASLKTHPNFIYSLPPTLTATNDIEDILYLGR